MKKQKKRAIKKTNVSEIDLYNSMIELINGYLKSKGCDETSVHEVSETLLGVTALHLGYYASIYRKNTAKAYIQYITTKLLELAVEAYEDNIMEGI